MDVALVADGSGGGLLCPLAADGSPERPPERVRDLAAAVRDHERERSPRWVWAATDRTYPALLAAGVRVARCHDAELSEGLWLAAAGRFGEPRSVAAAWARLRGAPVPADPAPPPLRQTQAALFDVAEPGTPDDAALLDMVVAVHRAQRDRTPPARLLIAAESAGALAAAEMGNDGVPWRADVHDAILTERLGPRPAAGLRPRRLQELSDSIIAAFGGRALNPDSPAQVIRAFAAEGITVPTTRSQVLKEIDHPAAPLLLQYKELARLHTAHGWAWLRSWVRDGRFRPDYVVGGVVSGRWATRGGGALQIPRIIRRAVVADPGWTLVVGDAAQLEPRVLAALAGDRALAAAGAAGDIYAALAGEFGGRRDQAKIALLAAMYGGGTGEAAQLLGVLRRRFPDAARHVEDAARAGEEGRLVRSLLGRTCPPPSAAWRDLVTGAADRPETEPAAARAMRSRGRFTRNFVVQATAADWALLLIAVLRRKLAASGSARLVFFQHDEVVVHAPLGEAETAAAALRQAAEEARVLMFGDTPVRFPLEIAITECYADAK